ncbi:MAG: hypothetical protein ABJF23_28465 [Bryobacteraceae bacterium]
MWLSFLLLAFTAVSSAQTGSDILLAAVRIHRGRVTVGQPVNITNRPGYDNQPSFTPDGRGLLFTSIREDKQADIYRYDLKTGQTERLTKTPESEFSPATGSGGKTFFTVRVEADQTQRLWEFQADGSSPKLVLDAVKPVGYFAFADARSVALFILGTPPTLQLADTRTGHSEVIASNIGRPILKIPGRHAISFLEKQADGVWWIKEVDPKTRKVKPIVKALEGSEYFAWAPDGTLLMTKGSKLYECRPLAGGEWIEAAEFPAKVSRVAVNSRGSQIAVVVDE